MWRSLGRPQKFFQAEKQPVLCFFAYFKDAVHESRGENYRVHKCDIFYYTEDDSFEVQWPRACFQPPGISYSLRENMLRVV